MGNLGDTDYEMTQATPVRKKHGQQFKSDKLWRR